MGEEILTAGAGAEERAIDQPVAWSARGNPAQLALLECSVFEVFFGGARGGGKTDGMLGEWANHADRYGKDAIGLMLRRTRTELIETIERSRAIYSLLGWKYNETEKMWRATNGARLRFAYLERDADADQYQGHSYTRLYVEEIGTFPSPAPIFKLMATLRSSAGVPVGFRATGNPGGPGHQWVKARYIDPVPLGNRIIRPRSITTATSMWRLTSRTCGLPAVRNSFPHGSMVTGRSPWARSSTAGAPNGTLLSPFWCRLSGCASVRWTGALLYRFLWVGGRSYRTISRLTAAFCPAGASFATGNGTA